MNKSAQIGSIVFWPVGNVSELLDAVYRFFLVMSIKLAEKISKSTESKWASKWPGISGSCESFTVKLTSSPCCPCSKQCSCRYCDSWVHRCTTQAPRSLPFFVGVRRTGTDDAGWRLWQLIVYRFYILHIFSLCTSASWTAMRALDMSNSPLHPPPRQGTGHVAARGSTSASQKKCQ